MARGVVLMVSLGLVESFEGDDLRHDWPLEGFRAVGALDVILGGLPLFFVGVEDRRAVLLAAVRPLAVLLRRVVRDGEGKIEQLRVRGFGG